MLGRAFQTCNLKNKNCSELLLANGMGLDRAPIKFQKLFFLNPLIRIIITTLMMMKQRVVHTFCKYLQKYDFLFHKQYFWLQKGGL